MEKILSLIAKITQDTQAPEWMLLFAAGMGELADGQKFLVDREAFDLVAAHVAARGNEVVFDYEHQTLQNVQAPAAGWIKELAWEEGVGIKARVAWTETAAQYIANKEYRYFSPVFGIRKRDLRVCGLHSSALTNTPKTNHLTPILAKLGSEETKEESMDRAKLIATLGLKDDATDAEILAAVAKLGINVPEAKAVLPKAVVAALDLTEDDGESVVVASIHALKQVEKNSVSMAEFNALKQEIAGNKAEKAVEAAIAKGKVTPDSKEWALDYAQKDPDGFEVYVAKAPVVVPLDKLPGKKKEGGGDGELSSETLAVAKQLGVSAEDIKNYSE